MDDLDRQPADFDDLSVAQQPVEIAPFRLDVRCAEDRAEDILDLADMFANRDPRPGPRLDQRRTGQMIGVDMRFQHPVDRDAFHFRGREQFDDRTVIDLARLPDRNPAPDRSRRRAGCLDPRRGR
jgi:hypothetical protein